MAGINFTYRKLGHNLVALFTFNLVAQQGNFTAAAEILGISQSAISQKIKTLEIELGVVLFKREHRGVTLTNEGMRLFNVTHPAMNKMGHSVSSLIERKLKPRVRLSADFAFSSFWLLPRLPYLRSELGDEIEIQILASQTPPEEDDDGSDLNIHVRPIKTLKDGGHLLIEEKVAAVCSSQYLEEHGPIKSPESLLNEQLLSLSRPPSAEWMTWHCWFEHLNITDNRQNVYNSFNNYDMVVQAAVAGHGIALGWLGLIDPLLKNGQLVKATDTIVTSKAGYVLERTSPSMSQGPDRVFEWIINQIHSEISSDESCIF